MRILHTSGHLISTGNLFDYLIVIIDIHNICYDAIVSLYLSSSRGCDANLVHFIFVFIFHFKE